MHCRYCSFLFHYQLRLFLFVFAPVGLFFFVLNVRVAWARL